MNKKMRTIVLVFSVVLCSIQVQSQIKGSRSFMFNENNNKVQKLQKKSVSHKKKGDVKIEFYGHMAFKITSPQGLTILIDPWRNDPTGTFGVWYPKDFPELVVDIAMSSHAHFDHDALYRCHATMNLERMAGEFKLGDVKVTGIAGKHQCKAPGEIDWSTYIAKEFGLDNICDYDRPMSWDNIIYIIETGGLRIGFWGDNDPVPNALAVEKLKNLDILIMNIDGSGHILSYEQVDSILNRFKPKAVIPGHYLSGDAVLPSSTLKTADEWVNKQKDVKKLNSAEFIFNRNKLKKAMNRVYYFGANYKRQ